MNPIFAIVLVWLAAACAAWAWRQGFNYRAKRDRWPFDGDTW
jgi:hypothetical protein